MSMTTVSPRLSIDPQLVWDLGYELLDVAYSTRMCDVWEVRHRTSYELFAWKQLRPEWEQDVTAQAGLQNEAAVARLVQSPLLPKLVASSVDRSPRYLLSKWFSRDTVEQAIQEFIQFPVGLALWITRQCAQGLNDLQQAGLSHGDLQAANVLIRENGTICLTELTQSRRIPAQGGMETPKRVIPSQGPLDDYAAVSQQYQPPQGTAKDLHGLGVILYRALTGHFPFEQFTAAEMLKGEAANPVVSVRRLRPEISEKIARLVGDLLSPDPVQRPRNASVVVHRLMELELEQLLAAV